jgi:hypothetical protein
MLSVVPGISHTMARSLLASHGSIAAVAAAAPEGLRRHPGIGRVRAARIAEALHGEFVAPVDRQAEAERRSRRPRQPRRWIVAEPRRGAEVQSFDRRSIALRALRAAADGARLIDGLTGEVLEVDAGPT